MTSKHITLLIIFCFGITINVFSQAKEITKAEYMQSFRKGSEMRFATSRRVNTQQEIYRNGKLFSITEITDEFLNPDKRHYLEIEKVADQTSKSELIKIGEIYYCRRDDGEWKQSQNWCSGGSGGSGIENMVSSKYTVEDAKINNKPAKLFKEYITYKNNYSPNKDREGLSYYQSSRLMDNDGFIVREEIKRGLIEPEIIYSKQTNSYEYNPKNFRIVAPIK